MAEIEQQPHDVTEAPVEAPADSRDASIDELLAQYDAETKQPEPTAEPESTVGGDEIDRLLADLGPDPKVAELEGQLGTANDELNSLRQAEYERAEQQAFDTFCAAIRDQIPRDNGLPERWVEDRLISMAVNDKSRTALDAWNYRNVDRNAVDQQLRQVEEAVNHLQRTGADPQKLAQLQELGTRLGHAFNSAAILTRLERAVIREAKAHKVYDPDVSADRNLVAQSVRDAGVGYVAPPPPNFGRMTDAEFRKWKLTNLGWE
jgi:hypothetical protein